MGRVPTMKIRPLSDRVLVERIDPEPKKKGGIIIPDSAKEKPQEAKVAAIGTGKLDKEGKRMPFNVKPGDRVYLDKYAGTDLKIDNKEYTIVREDEILGIIN